MEHLVLCSETEPVARYITAREAGTFGAVCMRAGLVAARGRLVRARTGKGSMGEGVASMKQISYIRISPPLKPSDFLAS